MTKTRRRSGIADFLEGKSVLETVLLTVIFPAAVAIASLRVKQIAFVGLITAGAWWILAFLGRKDLTQRYKKRAVRISWFMTIPFIVSICILWIVPALRGPEATEEIRATCAEVNTVASIWTGLGRITLEPEALFYAPPAQQDKLETALDELLVTANRSRVSELAEYASRMRSLFITSRTISQNLASVPRLGDLKGELVQVLGRFSAKCEDFGLDGAVREFGGYRGESTFSLSDEEVCQAAGRVVTLGIANMNAPETDAQVQKAINDTLIDFKIAAAQAANPTLRHSAVRYAAYLNQAAHRAKLTKLDHKNGQSDFETLDATCGIRRLFGPIDVP